MDSTKRKNDFSSTVDFVRVFGTFAVILGHMASPYSSFIYSWHMPLFFFLSGLFLQPKSSFLSSVTKNASRLLVPFFLFSLIGLGAEVLKRNILHRPSLSLGDELIGIFYWMDYSHLNHYGFVLWFLPALFLARIFVEFLDRNISSKMIIPFVISAIALPLYFIIGMTPFALTTGLMASIWLYSGTIFKMIVFSSTYAFRRLVVLPIAILLTIACYAFLSAPSMNFSELHFSSLLTNYLYSLCIIVIVFAWSFVFSGSKTFASMVKIIADDCFLLFIAHPYTNNIGHIFSEKFLTNSWYEKLLISLFLLLGIAIAWRGVRSIKRVVYA